jgi:hypothetical protein
VSVLDQIFELADAGLPDKVKGALIIAFVLIISRLAPDAYQHAWARYAHHETQPYLNMLHHLPRPTPPPAASS